MSLEEQQEQDSNLSYDHTTLRLVKITIYGQLLKINGSQKRYVHLTKLYFKVANSGSAGVGHTPL